MSEDQTIRILNQAVGIAKQRILVQENDIRQLTDKLKHKEAGIEAIKEHALQAMIEKHSHQKKAETSLLFMFLFGCLAAVSMAYSILNCQ